ncbi:ATP-dependent Clp protease ATP-binding subunit [Patescibacteria group bacterium]|nr:ATP-dependent Clp protease ATP-binding subunit [Patescibacteria group bacterium]
MIFLFEAFGKSLQKKHEEISFEVAKIFAHAKPTSTNILLTLLRRHQELDFVFQRALLDKKVLIDMLKKDSSPHTLPREAQPKTIPDLLYVLAKHNPLFQEFLIQHNLQAKDMYNLASWQWKIKKEKDERKKFWLKRNLRSIGSLGKDWAAGYTITLDNYSQDITKIVRRMNFPKAVAHEKEKESLARILSRSQINNALIIGEPGSGRERLLLDFASKSSLGEHGNPLLNYKRIIRLELSYLLSSLESREQVEQTLEHIFAEVVKAGNVILAIDEFHNFVGGRSDTQEAVTTMNITGILMSYLRSPNFPLITMTTFAGLHRYIEQNPSLLSMFEKIEVSEISEDDTLMVLLEKVPELEAMYNRAISYPALKVVIAYSSKYIQTMPMPKKAIDLLEETVVALAQTNEKILLEKHVARLLSEKTQIPIGEVEEAEREKLLNLEDLIHQRIINQTEAVKEVASSLRRARAEISSRNGPMGSFVFLGPTGVGKTETAKALAAIYFGSEKRMIRLDMSEFQNTQDVQRLLGTQNQDGLLTTTVREDPFSLILLDELEKAHPNILNLFLQVLDEGQITDGVGRKVDFRHTIIIATSNAGYRLILQAIKEGKDFTQLKQKMFDHLFAEGTFRPEFINRFDGVVLFRPLTQENLVDIAGLMLKKLQRNLEKQGIEFVITPSLKEKSARLGYNPIFGARNMRRVIQDKVENVLAKALLAKEVKRGDRITIQADNFIITPLEKYSIK